MGTWSRLDRDDVEKACSFDLDLVGAVYQRPASGRRERQQGGREEVERQKTGTSVDDSPFAGKMRDVSRCEALWVCQAMLT